MGEGEPTEKLSAKRQFVLVLRVTVEDNGSISGELVDPLTEQRRRFVGLDRLVDAVRAWVDGALGSSARNTGR
ncbi:hypothetical protein [Mycolicibacterium iranicum]|uniref:Uncharacterized protein n=1 Tax=Mycolicibacterium iranicum TaxID=912594 RepID=A0A178LU30_MYCIR|nr:hypothetical protein [Mycolicibacterium iranicum]OAN36772.1 hypothetical protein A4X20_06140 [Mycolicibacterium iranicum]